jgi:hypothetical protein
MPEGRMTKKMISNVALLVVVFVIELLCMCCHVECSRLPPAITLNQGVCDGSGAAGVLQTCI